MRRFLLLAALALGACAPANQRPALTPSLVEAQHAVTGDQVSARTQSSLVARYGGAYEHQAAEALVQETLAGLVKAAGIEGLPASVTLLNSASYNAFSLPNGQLFISRGMLALANDQAELAAALAHELGHVMARHIAQRVVERARAAADTADIARNFGDGEATEAAITAHRLSLAAFSRNQELEADRISIDLLAKAGYDPAGVLRLLRSLERISSLALKITGSPRREASPAATHPSTPERIAAAAQLLRSKTAKSGKTAREAYLAAIAGVAYGDDGSTGFIRGRTFIDPKLEAALTLPPSWLLFSLPQGFGAIKPGGKSIAIITPLSPAAAADPAAALKRLLDSAQTDAAMVPLPAGGAQGFQAAFTRETSDVRVAIALSGETLWRVVFTSSPHEAAIDSDFAQTLASLRAPGGQDRRIARPLALRVERAGGPGAVKRFAERAGNPDYGAQIILALNGFSDPAAVRAGFALKVPDFVQP